MDFDEKKTREAQNLPQIRDYESRGPAVMGPWTSHIWRSDPRHLGFLLSRYKFCAKILSGKRDVIEVGCGDGFGIPVVLQEVGTVVGVDFEPLVVEGTETRIPEEWAGRCSFAVKDMTESPMETTFDAAYTLDVIEHVPKEREEAFLTNIRLSLKPDGVLVIGTPNAEASRHASPAAAEGHVNLKTAEALRELLGRHFSNVFLLSMNDEVIHTGHHGMAHYLFGVGAGRRN